MVLLVVVDAVGDGVGVVGAGVGDGVLVAGDGVGDWVGQFPLEGKKD